MRNLIKNLHSFTLKDKEDLIVCFEDRLDFENDREPESDGMIHDDWDERVSDLEDIIDQLGSCEDEDDLKNIIEAIEDFQIVHGGLSRLKVN